MREVLSTPQSFKKLFRGAEVREARMAAVIETLLYYGFMGIQYGTEPAKFIFDVGYDMRILKVIVSKYPDSANYVLNPAFHPGLNL